MDVALYARVSSERQDVDFSIAAQLCHLREYAQQRGYRIVREYVDEAESGRSAHRPQFQRMIADARRQPRPFQVILVWKYSRFARSREDSIVYKTLLRKHGVVVAWMFRQGLQGWSLKRIARDLNARGILSPAG